MPQIVNFDNKTFIEPVVYSRIISGIINPPIPQEYGTILIIDTGLGANYGGGKGVKTGGSVNTLQDFIYQINNVQEILSLFKGGALYDISKKFYNPVPGVAGANKIFVARASDTTQGTLTLTFTDTKQIVQKTRDEGIIANGDITTITAKLLKGYACKLVAGTIDPTKFKIQYWIGTYKGKDTNGYYYSKEDENTAADSPQLLIESDEFTDFQDFIDWAVNNETYNEWFELDTLNTDTDGVVATADLTLLAGFNVFAGGTETYDASALTAVLNAIEELEYTFIFSTEIGATTNNITILNHILNDTKNYKKFLYVGGFATKDERGNASSTGNTTSIGAAKLFDSEYASVVHGAIYEPDYRNQSAFPTIKVQKNAMYKTAMLVGRKAGANPNTTMTYKTLGILMEVDPLEKQTDRELLLLYGVLHTRQISEGNVVNMDINTLQGNKNKYLFNPNGSSYQNSVMQIEEQVNKTLVFNLTPKIIGQSRSSLSKAEIIEAVNLELTALSNINLIIAFGNITAERNGTKWFINYELEVDTPYDGAFITGVVLDTGN